MKKLERACEGKEKGMVERAAAAAHAWVCVHCTCARYRYNAWVTCIGKFMLHACRNAYVWQ